MVLLAVVVCLGLLSGAGRETWSLGVLTCLVGMAVVIAPPVYRLPKVVLVCLGLIALVPLLGQLPVSWFGEPSAWRERLAESWRLFLPSTLSPDPHASLESWLVMVTAVFWLWICLGQRASEQGRRWCIYVLAIGGAFVAILSWIDYSVVAVPWWPRMTVQGLDSFGPFTNRNHTSSLNAITAILCAASAYDAYRRRSSLAWFFAALFWCPFAAILVNTSRGGLVLLVLGLFAWVTTAAMKKGVVRKLAVGAALLLVVISIASVSSGRLGSRIRNLMMEEKVSPLTSSLRFDLARETLSLASERPWLGQGFDTFIPVFPIVTSLSFPAQRVLHPESDVLLLLFEGGLLILVPCVVLLGWIGVSSGSLSGHASADEMNDRPGRRLRQAALIGACMALIHSIFDVPNHVLGYGMHTALLLGLAIRPRSLKRPAGRAGSMAFRLTGPVFIGLGVLWLGVSFAQWLPSLPVSVPVLRQQIRAESSQGRYRDALQLVNRAISISPLDYRLYYIRAQLLLKLRQNPELALLDFGRSRALEPHYAAICYEEGQYWLGYVPELAIIPWRECLRRHTDGSPGQQGAYGQMIYKTLPYPELRPPLWSLAETPEMQLIFLVNTAKGREWEEYLGKFMEAHPKLELLEPKELRTLLKAWHDRGDRTALVRLLEKNHSLQPYGWRTMAEELARAGKYQEAFYLANKFLKKQQRPSRLETSNTARLERAFVFNPTDVRPGIELYLAYRAEGNLKAAKSTAEKVVALPAAPPYMKLELASLYAEMSDFRRAWQMMEQAMHSHPDI